MNRNVNKNEIIILSHCSFNFSDKRHHSRPGDQSSLNSRRNLEKFHQELSRCYIFFALFLCKNSKFTVYLLHTEARKKFFVSLPAVYTVHIMLCHQGFYQIDSSNNLAYQILYSRNKHQIYEHWLLKLSKIS